MIQVSGMVITGAGIVSLQRLHRIAKSQRPESGTFHIGTSLGENKAKIIHTLVVYNFPIRSPGCDQSCKSCSTANFVCGWRLTFHS